jgi:hypothetical protein
MNMRMAWAMRSIECKYRRINSKMPILRRLHSEISLIVRSLNSSPSFSLWRLNSKTLANLSLGLILHCSYLKIGTISTTTFISFAKMNRMLNRFKTWIYRWKSLSLTLATPMKISLRMNRMVGEAGIKMKKE